MNLVEKDLKYIWHPCSQMKDYEELKPIIIDRGKGIYLYDIHGKEYMDVVSSWSVSYTHLWNVKYKKSGRAVCTLYPEDGYYICMVSVGGKAAEGADEVLVECTPYVREVYAKAKPFNGSRWLMINVTDALILEDVKALIRLRMASK